MGPRLASRGLILGVRVSLRRQLRAHTRTHNARMLPRAQTALLMTDQTQDVKQGEGSNAGLRPGTPRPCAHESPAGGWAVTPQAQQQDG